jgi:hypothetical protein
MKEVRARVVLSAKSLATCCRIVSVGYSSMVRQKCTHFCDPANVLFAVFRREA